MTYRITIVTAQKSVVMRKLLRIKGMKTAFKTAKKSDHRYGAGWQNEGQPAVTYQLSI